MPSGVEQRNRPRWRRIVRRTWPLSLLAPIALWLTFQHKPGWYRPVTPDDAIVQRARREVALLADAIGDALVQRKSYELVVTDRTLNEWLASMPQVWPDVAEHWPSELTQPAVSFQPGLVRLGIHGETRGWRVILGFAFALTTGHIDDELDLSLIGIQGGSLPIPRFAIRKSVAFTEGPGSGHSVMAAMPDQNSVVEWEDLFRTPRSVDDWFSGVQLRNRFVWPNGRRPFRISALAITDGELRARLDPL